MSGLVQRKPKSATGPTRATCRLLWARCDGRCELCGRELTAWIGFSRHHRQPRGMGGSQAAWINSPVNLVLLCGSATTADGCHTWVERRRDQARALGLLVPRPLDPATIPVLVGAATDDPRLVYLTEDGEYSDGVP